MLRIRRVAFVLTLLLAAPAQAVIIPLTATIDCSQEVPSTCGGSSGSGSASITLDNVTNLLSWDISWSGLTGAATGMHFHGPAPAGVNAGVQVDIGGISGLASPSVGSTTISAAQASDLLNGLWYINIHTATFPGGEIRGQVVPEPTTAALLGLGLVGLAVSRRRTALH